MRKDDVVRLRHMLDAAVEALSFAEGRDRMDLEVDRQFALALVKEVEIIGEAAYQLSAETREAIPAMPWNEIIGMRHRLVHGYFDLNYDILWRTVEDELPMLVELLEASVPPEML